MLRLSYQYPDSVAEALIYGTLWILLLVVTYRLARVRRLPGFYAFYGLLFLTGSVYVFTLDKRSDGAESFRNSVALRLARHPMLLAILTFGMGIALVLGVFLLVLTLLSLWGPSKVYVNGHEAQGFLWMIPAVLIELYFVMLGLFHFVFTRRRIKAVVREWWKAHGKPSV